MPTAFTVAEVRAQHANDATRQTALQPKTDECNTPAMRRRNEGKTIAMLQLGRCLGGRALAAQPGTR
jgi:hypothetical protein